MIAQFVNDNPFPGDALQKGLYLINQLMDQFSSSGIYLPTITKFEFDLIPGKAGYTFSNIVPADFFTNRIADLEYVNVNQGASPSVGNIIFPMKILERGQVYNATRSLSQGFPWYVLFESFPQYSQINFGPTPDQIYKCEIHAKFMIDQFILFSDISEVPIYYQRFMQYALARELLNFYPSSNWNPAAESEYNRMFKDLSSANQSDMTISSSSLLKGRYGYSNWGNNAV
jgi:hypothetical protein